MDDLTRYKEEAARAGVALVRSGMVVGLGSGSTADFATAELGRRIASGALTDVQGVPTSVATERAARTAGIPLLELGEAGVDVAIDGVDEVTDDLDAIKGLGGALLREKVVAASARTFVLVGDHTKRVPLLGTRAPVPVEVLGFGWRQTASRIEEQGLQPHLRQSGGTPFRTDNGNLVLDCVVRPGFGTRPFLAALARVPGVLAHGLFLGMAHIAYLAGPEGIETLTRGDDAREEPS